MVKKLATSSWMPKTLAPMYQSMMLMPYIVLTNNVEMLDLDAALNQEMSPIPYLDLSVKNPESTRDIGKSIVGIGDIAISQNAEKLVTSLKVSLSVVKIVLTNVAKGLSVEMLSTAEQSASTIEKSTTLPKKSLTLNVESTPMLVRTLVPSIFFYFKKRTTEKSATIEESLSVPTKSVGNSMAIIKKSLTDIVLAIGVWESGAKDLREGTNNPLNTNTMSVIVIGSSNSTDNPHRPTNDTVVTKRPSKHQLDKSLALGGMEQHKSTRKRRRKNKQSIESSTPHG